MLSTPAYAAASATSILAPFSIERREPGPHEVLIDIAWCGVCHSDVHQARGEWKGSIFPMVPGHEIVGTVARVGSQVQKWKPGDTVGVGVFVDSCRSCAACHAGDQQYCEYARVRLMAATRLASRSTKTTYCVSLRTCRSSASHRCSAQASRPIRRYAIGTSRPATKSPS